METRVNAKYNLATVMERIMEHWQGGGNLGLRTTHIKHLVMPDYIIFFEIFEIEEVKTGTSKQVF